MLLKLFLMARDRSFLFFSMALPFLFSVIALDAAIMGIVYHLLLKQNNTSSGNIYLVVTLISLPLIPVFCVILFLFLEFYFFITLGMLPVKWTSVFRRRKFVNALIAWADKKHTQEMGEE